jgi:endonuclease YncB( thermonuclease family)
MRDIAGASGTVARARDGRVTGAYAAGMETRTAHEHGPRVRRATVEAVDRTTGRAAWALLVVALVALVTLILASACAGDGGPTPPVADGAQQRPTGPTREASLARVVDGDTIRVLVDGVEERVRYIGIDTPELNETSQATPEPYAEAATAANARLLAEGRLVLEKDVSERDRYGRLLRDIWVEQEGTWTLLNLALVAEGFAQVSTYPPDVRYVEVLLAAQAEARATGHGLWGEPAR